MSNHAAPSNGAKWVLRGWRKAWEEFAQQYKTAPQLVLEVRNDTRNLSDPAVIKELLDTYGRFDISHEGLALGTTVGVISLMLGKKFGRRRKLDGSAFAYQFHKQFEGSARQRFAIFSSSTKTPKKVKESGGQAAGKTQLPVVSATASTTPAVKVVAKGPSQADLERLIEIHRLRVDDLELAVLATVARVWSEAHLRVSQELVRLTLQRLDKEEMARKVQVQADAERRARIESGEFLHVTNVYEPPPVLPIPESASIDDPDDEDEDVEPELSTESDGEDDEELLEELDVPVEFAGQAPRGVESSDDDEVVVGSKIVKAPSGEEDRDMGAEILKGRILEALGLVNTKHDWAQIVVIGNEPVDGCSFIENISAYNDQLYEDNELPRRIRAAVVLHKCYDLPSFKDKLQELKKGSPGSVEWVNGGVTRELLLEALREKFGEPEIQGKPATAAPTASPTNVDKGQKNAPRVTFKLLSKGEFPSDPSWANQEFVAKQVPTLPHGLCCKEIGEELARRAGLVGRKCTVGSIQLAFSYHLLDNREDAKTLEMVKLQHSPRAGTYNTVPYVVPAGGQRGKAVLAKASGSVPETVKPVSQPKPETATATAEADDGEGRKSRFWPVFSREVPKLSADILPVDRNRRLKAALTAEDISFTERGFQSSYSRWHKAHPEVVPAAVEPTTNGHAEGAVSPPAPAPAPVIHEESAASVPPAPAAAPVPEPPAPVQVAAVSPLLSSELEKALLLIAGSAVQARVQQLTEENAQLRKELEKVRREHEAFKLRIRDAGEQLIADSLSG